MHLKGIVIENIVGKEENAGPKKKTLVTIFSCPHNVDWPISYL